LLSRLVRSACVHVELDVLSSAKSPGMLVKVEGGCRGIYSQSGSGLADAKAHMRCSWLVN
jgi:hypothetical protein